jgi:chaperonin cofactor prefoldin
MAPPTHTPSPRLVKAAEAEREQLARHRRELLEARESLRAELERIEGSLEELVERETLLARLTGPPPTRPQLGDGEEGLARRTSAEDEALVLRGPAIRREAVRVLLSEPDRPEAMHYRAWFSLLEADGFHVAGKDPLATFLTQLSRSPAVRKSTQAGVYELDRGALRRLRRRRDELQDELRALTAPGQGTEVSVLRTRRTELNTELGRLEKALEEVELLFADVPAGEPPLTAAA